MKMNNTSAKLQETLDEFKKNREEVDELKRKKQELLLRVKVLEEELALKK